MTRSIADLRVAIDAVDQQLLQLLNDRAALANEVGDIKRKEGSQVFRPEREAQVIHTLQQSNPGPLKGNNVANIWREIMSACRALEAPQRVAYLGPAGTFSEQAAEAFFGVSIDHVPCASFDEVFDATTSGRADFGVVPMENSTEGAVTRSLDLFLTSPLHMIGETSLLVRHNLLCSQQTPLEEIEAVYAHPQALAQCQNWLSVHAPQAERHAASSNAEGARIAASNPKWAAIASLRAASQFGLHVVAPAIQDEAYNRTRFAVMCLPQTMAMPEASGNHCTSLVLSVVNRPGAVYELLEPLKRHNVSMTRFESRPARSGQQWEYFFYIDLVGHISEPHVAAALADLRPICAYYKVLGSCAING